MLYLKIFSIVSLEIIPSVYKKFVLYRMIEYFALCKCNKIYLVMFYWALRLPVILLLKTIPQ